MKKLILFVMLISGFLAARADFASPDFAFPQTVIQDAEAHLKTAQGLSRMKAVMEIVTAKSSIDNDSLYNMPAFIASLAKSEQDAKVRGLMLLYEANTLNRIYDQNRWKFDRVQSPLLPLPSNPSEWSGEQFKYSVRQLTDSALTILKPYFKTPLTDYKEVVKLDDVSPEFYPYLRDFLYNQALQLNGDNTNLYLYAITGLCEKGTPEWALWATYNKSEYKALVELYKKYPDGLCGGFLLWSAISQRIYEQFPVDFDAIVSLLKTYLDKQPANVITPALKSQYDMLTSPSCSLELPEFAQSGVDIKIPCKFVNTGKIGLKISRMSPQTGDNIRNAVFYKNVINKVDKVIAINTDTLSFNVAEPGRYYLELVCDGIKSSRGEIVTFTPWSPIALSDRNKYIFIVPEYASGAPVRDASVSMFLTDKKQFKLLGKTDSDGMLTYALPKDKKPFYNPVQISDKNGKKVYYGYNLVVSKSYEDNISDKTVGSMFVDRPAYHPGDTVCWSAVLATKNDNARTSALLKDKEIKVVFYDANHTPLDTLQCTTDRYGRASGEFYIPDNLLSGSFSVVAQGKGYYISAPVMVSDFKAPVFELKDVQVVKSGTDYIVEGRALRYSGASVPGAEVKVDLSASLYYTFWNPGWGEKEATFTGVTEADGSFKIKIPADTLTYDNYRCEVVVTSQSADIAEETVCFRAGKPYLLVGETNDKAINLDSPTRLNIFAFGSNLKSTSLQAKWQLADDTKKVVADGTCQIDSLGATFDFAKVPVGQYSLSVCPTDTTMFDTLEAGKIQLYSEKQNKLPASLKLIAPVEKFDISPKDTKLDLKLGVFDESYVYIVTRNIDNQLVAKLHRLSPGFSTLKINLESPLANQQIQVYTVKNGEVNSLDIQVKRVAPSEKLVLKGESWRDRLVPGAAEQWRLKLSAENGDVASGALVATMYNHALDALATLSWPADLQTVLQPNSNLFWQSISCLRNYNNNLWYRLEKRISNYFTVGTPSFLYNDNMFGSRIMIRGTARKMAATGSANIVFKESAVEESVDMAYDMAAPMPSPEVAESEKTEADAGEGNTQEDFQFRAAETLQAFWMPSLTIDDNGEATLNFVVPNAIGAWSFRATAWTEDCRAASMLATLTASKPVMVQPTLPRFMRRGDRLTVLATVMNNTDSVITAATTIELFNPADGKVLSTVNSSSEIPAKGQTLVPCELEAPVGLSNIGYRVKSTDGNFTDGEQALIPILEATTTAIDSELFYLTPSDSVFTARIPADLSGKGIVAVQYCQNPVWDVVRTLPSLYDFEPKTAAGASASAYAAMVAKGLLGQFPEIRNVLDIWQASPADSAFVSRLYKNEDLKLALLAQTPFVGSANAMSEQMQRLALTFDEKTINKVLETSVSKLAALQRADGGFAWGSWSNESSQWTTRSVLATIGRLQNLGYKITDKKLLSIIDRAFGYIDSQVDIEDYGYTFIYSLYPDRKPSRVKGRQSIERVKQRIIANWKKSTTARKATDALILDALGNKAVARNIMSSVKQFAQPNAKRGTSFGSVLTVDAYSLLLEAFARITPDDRPIIDGMRQWLILQTQANDDLFAWDPTTLVAAILSTGSRWTSIPTGTTAAVTVDGAPLALSKVESVTGTFSQRLAPSASQRVLRVARPEGSPVSYGSVVTVATQPMASVKPRECDGISIAKRFLVEREGKWVETESFTLGERVRVQLLVKASRNMEYITINDDRPSAFEPVDQMPGWIYNGGTPAAYRENSDTRTRLFIYNLPKGTYYYTYDMTATFTGTFASGAATFQSQYAPELTARSGASTVSVTK